MIEERKKNKATTYLFQKPFLGDTKMIMQMTQELLEKEHKEAKRTFTRILDAAKPYLNVIARDDENHVARCVLETQDTGYPAVLTYDPCKKTFVMFILFHIKNDLTMPRVMVLLRLQNHTAIGSSSINLDTESSTLRVKSHARLPVPNVAQAVVTAAVKDAIHVLENDDFRRFVN
jgi:hypothetical protein